MKKEQGICKGKTCFLKSFLVMSHNLKKNNPDKMKMDDLNRIILVPLNFILQGVSNKNQK